MAPLMILVNDLRFSHRLWLIAVLQVVHMYHLYPLPICNLHCEWTFHCDNLPLAFPLSIQLPGCWNRQPDPITNFEDWTLGVLIILGFLVGCGLSYVAFYQIL